MKDLNKLFYFLSVVFFSTLVLNSCSRKKSTTVDRVEPQVANSGAIAGTLRMESGCSNSGATVYLITNSQIVYQVNVVPGSSYEVQVQPGQYSLVGETGQRDCVDERIVRVDKNRVMGVDLNLRLVQQPQYGGTPQYPGYDGYDYYSDPCAWGSYGCYGNMYPGYGDMFAGKPNIYMSAPTKLKFDIQLRMAPATNLLFATPLHGKQGWQGQYVEQQIVVDEVSHNYLFYDVRLNSSTLQAKEGVCVDRLQLVPEMVNYLRTAGFQENEIKDFEEHWTKKSPKGERFCIFPQENAEIDPMVGLRIYPKPDSLVRIWFVVVPENLSSKSNSPLHKTAKLPDKYAKWANVPEKARSIARRAIVPGTRKLALTGETHFEVREWGVAFLVELQ